MRDLLNSHPQVQCDEEILRFKKIFPKAFLKHKASLSNKMVYGFKVKIYQLTDCQMIQNPKQFISCLHKNGWKIIYLKRKNILRQAISNLIVVERKASFRLVGDGGYNINRITVDCNKIIEKMEEREGYLAREHQVLNGIPHINIVYEEDLKDSGNHQSTSDKVFNYLGIPSYPVRTQFAKIVPHQLKDVIKNYNQMVGIVGRTKYAKYLTF